MRIVSVEWKNFNSYGNQASRIELSNAGDLFLLLGGNGNGKSTISEVITFSLYGKLERKNKGDLPNRINKNLWCRIVVISKGKKIIITRGVSPGLFEVDIDGIPYDTSGNSNVQDYLEYELFDIPYQVFKNIIVLSINDFRSFLTMSAGDKRNIVDRLFGFTLINTMRDSIRIERREIRDQLKTINDELGIIEDAILSINKKIESLEQSKIEDNAKLALEYKQKIVELVDQKKNLEGLVGKIKEKEAAITERLSKEKLDLSELNFEIKSANDKINLYSNNQCPTCGTDLHTDHHQSLKESITNDLKEKQNKREELNTLVLDLQGKSKEISAKINEIQSQVIKINLMINQYKNEAVNLVNQTKDLDENYLQQLVRENQQKAKERKSNQGKKIQEDTFLDVVETVLGDDGVKNLAMKTILPSLNQSIQNMAAQIHLPYMIKFDDKFNCIINALGEEINPKSMSTGERKKADFIIIIAMLKILKIRYPSLNLLFLDEIFSSVDSSGIYEIIKILSEVSKENNLNTWVINHTELPMELFDKKVEAYKEGGFSKLKIENIS
jgi:DNA repair exonuclease SbcCD ATPase subunit